MVFDMSNKKHFKWIISIFIMITVILTFFSRTLYNYSLPVVNAAKPGSGKVVNVVEARMLLYDKDTYDIYAGTSGKVTEICVLINEEVKKGDVLARLEVDAEVIQSLQRDIQNKEQELQLLELALNHLHGAVDPVDTSYESGEIIRITAEIEQLEQEIVTIDNGSFASLQKTILLNEIETTKAEWQIAKAEWEKAKAEQDKNASVSSNQADSSSLSWDSTGKSIKEAEYNYQIFLEAEKESRKEKIVQNKEKIKNLEKIIADILKSNKSNKKENQYNLLNQQLKLEYAKTELEALKRELSNAENQVVISDYDGFVRAVHIDTGKYISKNDELFRVASPTGEYVGEITIHEKQREYINMESTVEIKIAGNYEKMIGKISAVTPVQDDPESYIVTVTAETANRELSGVSVAVTIKTESELYEVMIPNSALHKDGKGYYVLTMQEVTGVLGKSYQAKRADVSLLDSDENYCAIEGLVYMTPIIIKSDKIVSEGDIVRYEDAGQSE